MLEVVEQPIAEGTVIAGVYRLERRIGEGGMGEVWAARDAGGAVVALKVARAGGPAERKHVERMLREARAASLVRHPNVVPLLAVVETDTGLPCLVMPLLEGESLRAVLTRRGRLPWPECARLFSGMVAGLGAVHAAGLVHRDLKPENVHLRGDHPLLLDFGIAKEVVAGPIGETVSPSLTSTGVLIGTPYYMAPEQIFGDRDIDARADVWALGLMLYEALTGTLPTRAEGFGPVMKRVTTADFPAVSSLVAEVPAALSQLVQAMLSRERSSRPALEVVAAALAGLAGSRSPLVAPPPGLAVPASGVLPSPYASTALFVPGGSGAAPPPTLPSPAEKRGRGGLVAGLVLLGFVGVGAAGLGVRSYLAPGLGAVPSGAVSAPPSGGPVPEIDPQRTVPSAPLASASAAPSAPRKKLPDPPPPPTGSAKAEQHAAFDAVTGNYSGMGPELPELLRAVNAGLPKLRPCFPSPENGIAWSVALRVFWPKGGARIARATPVKNGASQEPAAESAAIVSCVERTFATFAIPAATGQAENDGGAAYLFASVGYRWRFGPAPK